ncbi:MFS transporter [Microbispora sp. RL4-1S]|uniref:MFS transporter n=1 Tax=Microbispora oryzae TaxID=2806554 RepID=A0A940WS62_9ACTN|nr:MFS transporter [Microbispora oryzae]MBP2708667.1 MFS transporter [Microbispora oryzae]
MTTQSVEARAAVPAPSASRHAAGFWIVAAAFAVEMAFSSAPTPLWTLYRQRDHFSTMMVTVAFAAYAVGVVVSLFLAGHVSDWLGRRRVLLPAILLQAVAAVLFLVWPDLPGLVVARVVSGLSVGMATATATAHLAELGAASRPNASPNRPVLVATAANLGGIGLGPLVAGVLVRYVDGKLTVPFAVFLVLLIVSAVALALVPETVAIERGRTYRPQRVAVPSTARARYFAVGGAAFALFAILGLFTSVAPAFLAAIGQSSPIVAGLAAFLVFGGAAVAQIALGRLPLARQLAVGFTLTAVGVVVLAAGVLSSSSPAFLAGGLVAGAGAGSLLKGSLGTAATLAPAGARGEAIAGIFLAGYVGLALPILGIGFATGLGVSLAASLTGLAVLVLAIMAVASATLRRHPATA